MITTVPFGPHHLPQIRSWWTLGVPFVDRPDQAWADYVLSTPTVHCLCSLDGGRVVAYSQTDREGGVGAIGIVVHPHVQRQGLGTRHLREAIGILSAAGVAILRAHVEGSNRPSIAFFEANGFAATGSDGTGLQVFELGIGPLD